MLRAQSVKYTYPDSEPLVFPDIICDKEEPSLILGPSGSGKTTLLHLLAGLRTAGEGVIEIAGKDIGRMKKSELDKFRGQNIGVVFQEAHFVAALDVADNLRLSEYLAGKPVNDERVLHLLERMNIFDKAFKNPSQLSAGEKQRVSIAMALINKPDLILADEPTSALDDKNAEAVIHLLLEEAKSLGSTLVVVTHDQRLKGEFKKEINL